MFWNSPGSECSWPVSSAPSPSYLTNLRKNGLLGATLSVLQELIGWLMPPSQVADIETDPCGQFSYPTIQYLPADGSIFVAYTNLFSPSAMSPECRVRTPMLSCYKYYNPTIVFSISNACSSLACHSARPVCFIVCSNRDGAYIAVHD